MTAPMLFAIESWLVDAQGQPNRRCWRFMMSGEWWVDWEAVGFCMTQDSFRFDVSMIAIARLLLAAKDNLTLVTFEESDRLGVEAAVRMNEQMRAYQEAVAEKMRVEGYTDGDRQAVTELGHVLPPRVVH